MTICGQCHVLYNKRLSLRVTILVVWETNIAPGGQWPLIGGTSWKPTEGHKVGLLACLRQRGSHTKGDSPQERNLSQFCLKMLERWRSTWMGDNCSKDENFTANVLNRNDQLWFQWTQGSNGKKPCHGITQQKLSFKRNINVANCVFLNKKKV